MKKETRKIDITRIHLKETLKGAIKKRRHEKDTLNKETLKGDIKR